MTINSLFSLEHKTAFVTGASRGLGQAIAIGLAQAGAKVLCSCSSEGGCHQTLAKIKASNGDAEEVVMRLDRLDEVETTIKQVLAQHSLNILVNCGGTIARYPAHEFPMAEWLKVMDVNLNSAFLLSQKVGQQMLEQGRGKIINIASMLSYTGGVTVPAYTASKHGIAGLTKALANEWASSNVQVNAIAPGYFRTDNTQALQQDKVRNLEIEKRIPAGSWGEPEQLVGTAIYLASAASDYVNGHILAVDGGWLAR